MAKTKVAVKDSPQVPERQTTIPNRNAVLDVYLLTNTGLKMLTRGDAQDVRKQVEEDTTHSLLDYRFFDEDNKRWAYWAVVDGNGGVKPVQFPGTQQYSLTSLQLFAKAVSYVIILAHAIGLLKQKPPTLWDKMLKPTTIIMAIVGIMFVMGLMLLALTG